MSANGFYDLTPIYPPSFVGRNLSFVTGFTHRTNITYLELLMEMYKWLRDTHIPEIDKVLEDFRDKYENDFKSFVDKYESDLKEALDDISNVKTNWQQLFDEFMADVVNRLEALNDQAMANLIRDKTSLVFEALKEVFSPFIVATNYATGNGVTDDTEGLQKALDLAENKTLIIPHGEYKITKTLRVRKNTVIYMYGAHIKLWTTNTAGVLLLTNGNTGDEFTEYNGNGNISIYGGIWDSQAHLNAMNSSNGFAFGHARNIRFIDTEIRNLSQGHAIELNALKNVRITNCKFMGWGSTSLTSEAIQLDYASTAGFPAFGLPDGTPCEDVEISGCEFGASKELPEWGVAIGGHTANIDKPFRDIRILNNKIKVRAWGIVPYYWTNLIIDSNQIDGGGINARAVVASISDITISKNSVRNAPNFAIGLRGSVNGYNCLEATISDNIIDTNANNYSALLVDYSPLVKVTGNHVVRAGYQAIRIMNSAESTIQGNVVRNSVREGIVVTENSQHALVTGNHVSAAGRGGIEINAHNCRVESNYVRGFSLEVDKASAGIRIYDCIQCSVVNNSVRAGTAVNQGTFGLVIQATASYIYAMGNDLRGSGAQGSMLDEGNSSIKTPQNLV